MIDLYLDESNDALAHDVSFLGRILGEVLLEQGGAALFDSVEGLRRACRHMRHHDCEAARHEIEERVAAIPDEYVGMVVRAFTVYFHLINMAEENHRLRRLAARETRTYPAPRPESIAAAIASLASAGRSAAEVDTLLASIRIRPVFTAHPTEARRMTLLGHLRRISGLVGALNLESTAPSVLRDVTRRLYAEVTNLWQTDELRTRPQMVLDEVRNGLYFFDSSVFDVTGRIYRELHDALQQYYPELEATSYQFLAFGSWIGGDRDGNPNVTPEVTEETLRLHKAMVLTKYVEAIDDLSRRLTVSSNLVGVSQELLQSLAKDSEGPIEVLRRERSPAEPYRQKLHVIRLRLLATYSANKIRWRNWDTTESHESTPPYRTPEELLYDLDLIQRSLTEHCGVRLADDSLKELIWQVQTFGFHLARLDIRQHRSAHLAVLDELFPADADRGAFSTWTEDERTHTLTQALLDGGKPPEISHLSADARATIEVFERVRSMQSEVGESAVDTYIVSFTKGAGDVLAVLYLAWIANLFDPSTDACPLRPVPLFETGEDLEAATGIMDALYANPVFRRHIREHGNEQEVMIGYSDSDKDAGYVTSNWWLYRAQRDLTEAASQAGISLTFFHGRGGAIGRGGGPLQRAIAGQPAGTVAGRLKVTEQGEVLFSRYANPGIAHRHLEQLVHAVVMASVSPPIDEHRAQVWHEIMTRVSADASRTYAGLVRDDAGFLQFFEEGTPLRSIMGLRIASRPAQRSSGRLQIEDLRAIPWVFAWTQSRFGIPGWYGLGTGLAMQIERAGVEELREMYRDWPFFRWLIDAAQISLGKADLGISRLYSGLVDDSTIRDRFEGILRGEFERTCRTVNIVVQQSRLLDSWPVLQRSIELRNPYVDPMSYLQVRAIRQLRSTQNESQADQLRLVIERSISGIAAGLQNTG